MNKRFISEVNKMKLLNDDSKSKVSAEDFCHKIKLYSQKNLVAVFATGGHYLVDTNNGLFYYSEEDILRKYWETFSQNAFSQNTFSPDENCHGLSNDLALLENVDSIVLERVFVNKFLGKTSNGYLYETSYMPKKRILKKKMNKHFINEVNKMKLQLLDNEELRNRTFLYVSCHEIKLYSQKNLVAIFRAGDHYLFDTNNGLFYYSEEDIFRKYWNVSSAYEECIN
jgi:predicted ribosome-associated RNA-binding protein Tma20